MYDLPYHPLSRFLLCSFHPSELLLTWLNQTVTGYRQLIPDFDGFLGRLSPMDQQALREKYAI